VISLNEGLHQDRVLSVLSGMDFGDGTWWDHIQMKFKFGGSIGYVPKKINH
jgi:hypothetical protein